MSWTASYTGHSKDLVLVVERPDESSLDERSKAQLAAAREAASGLVGALGDCHVAVMASGHANPEPGSAGDTLAVSVHSVEEPAPG